MPYPVARAIDDISVGERIVSETHMVVAEVGNAAVYRHRDIPNNVHDHRLPEHSICVAHERVPSDQSGSGSAARNLGVYDR